MTWKSMSILALAAVLLLSGFGSAPKASAALSAVGPVDAATGYPLWYQDENGLSLALCLDVASGFCGEIVLPSPGDPISLPDNFPDEAFYWSADALMPSGDPLLSGQALLVLAMEAAFDDDTGAVVPGNQISFGRIRIRVDNLVGGATYTVTHPFGVESLTAAVDGSIDFTVDIGCELVPCAFAAALGSGVGPFLTWDGTLPAPPPGFIGNPLIDHRIIGSPLGTNLFRIEGLNVGGTGVDMIETDMFSVTGKIFAAAPPPPPAAPMLRVTTSPPVPSQISIDGVPRDTWALDWLKLPPGTYNVSFSDAVGFISPSVQVVTVTEGATTELAGAFIQKGFLRVMTFPAVAGTIMVNGIPRNDWGMWTDLLPGSYEVCFGAVEGFDTPPCQTTSLIAGFMAEVTGTYHPNALAPAPTGFGMLRVVTSPPVPAEVVIDGIDRDMWSLNWLKLAPGTYELGFTDVPGFTTPAPQMVTITEGVTTEVIGAFTQNGYLRASVSPALPATITVDTVPRNDWGMWTDLLPSTYTVCFGEVPGFTAPACVALPVIAGSTTEVIGVYSP